MPNDTTDELDKEIDDTPSLKVEVVNQPKATNKEISIYDSTECIEYDEMLITDKEIEEAQDGNSPT